MLDNNVVHKATVDYVNGVLRVFLDGAGTPLLTVNVNLAATLNLAAGGKAWVGFTAATGQGYQTHDIVSWQFAPLTSALLAQGRPATGIRGKTLTNGDVSPLLAEAFARWQAAGVDVSGLGHLGDIHIEIANLGGRTLGMAAGHTIWLDDNAASWGWFVDPTPASDSEFVQRANQSEQGRIDALTVIMHELGHVLGHDHDEGDSVMSETLATGERQTPEATHAVDRLFAQSVAQGPSLLTRPAYSADVIQALASVSKSKRRF